MTHPVPAAPTGAGASVAEPSTETGDRPGPLMGWESMAHDKSGRGPPTLKRQGAQHKDRPPKGPPWEITHSHVLREKKRMVTVGMMCEVLSPQNVVHYGPKARTQGRILF